MTSPGYSRQVLIGVFRGGGGRRLEGRLPPVGSSSLCDYLILSVILVFFFLEGRCVHGAGDMTR